MRSRKEMGPLRPVEMILGPWPTEEERRGQAHWALEMGGDRNNVDVCLNGPKVDVLEMINTPKMQMQTL
jgi:hypothetical protein